MKKIILSLGLMVAATFALTNCAKDGAVATEEENQFSLFAGIDTKTVNDGLSTNWVADDAMSVFYIKSDDAQASYSNNVKFSISTSDLTAKRFTTSTKITLSEASYDWCAIYPYNSNIPSPANKTTNGYLTVGGVAQTQSGNNSTAHLCGNACPLYGVVKGVAVGTSPSIQMKNVTSVVEFVVTNSTSKAFKVTKIVFTAGEDIVGTYYIDFTANPVAFVGSGANYVSKNAILTVKDGANLAVGSTAKFYIAIKPFTTTAGLTAKVYAEDADASVGSYTKEIAAASRTFTAGKIKTVNVAVDNLVSEKVYTISEVLAAGATSKHDEVIGTYNTMAPATVMAINNSNVVLKDETGTILFYKSSTGLAVGDVVNYSGAVKNFNGIIEFTGNVAIEKTGTTTVSHNPQAIDGTALEAYSSAPATECVSFKGTCDNNGYVSIKGTTKKIRLFGTYTDYKSKAVNVVGYAYGYNATSSYASVIITTIEEDTTAPTLSVSPASKTWANTAKDAAVFTVTSTNGSWNLSYDTAADTYFTIVSDKTNGKITVTPKGENTSAAAYEYTLTVTHENDTDLKKTIAIKQSKKTSSIIEVDTILWAETWDGAGASVQPSAYKFSGTTVFGGAKVTYANSSVNTLTYDDTLAGGTKPELLLSKSNQTWTITGIPFTGVSTAKLTFLANKTTFTVSSATPGVTISGSGKEWTVSATSSVNTISLEIKNTGSANARVDNTNLVVTKML